MIKIHKAGVIAATAMTFGSLATAQNAKEVKVQSDKSVVIANLLSERPDCSSDPGRLAIPVVREQPTNGAVQMQILLSNVQPVGNCPARRIPSLGLIYTPTKGFVGTDMVAVEVDEGNKPTILNFRITVEPTN